MTDKPSRTSLFTTRLVESDPFRDWLRSPFQSRLSRLLRDPVLEGESSVVWSPALDLSETQDGYVITVELAGARKEDINVECHDNLLTIRGEKKSEREEQDEHRHYVERSYGSFSRSFRLPSDASEDQLKASFKDGVLSVSIPKAEERKPRSVAIGS